MAEERRVGGFGARPAAGFQRTLGESPGVALTRQALGFDWRELCGVRVPEGFGGFNVACGFGGPALASSTRSASRRVS